MDFWRHTRVVRAIWLCLIITTSAGFGAYAQDAAADAALAKAQAEAAKAQLDLVKAKAEADSARYAAEQDRIKAAQAAVPASGLTNSATLTGDKAGIAETNYLATMAVSRAATDITTDINMRAPGGQPLVLFGGMTAPDISEWQAFSEQLDELDRLFKQAFQQAEKAAKEGEWTREIPEPPLAAAGILPLLPAILSYLSSNETLGGLALSLEDSILETAVAGKLIAANRTVMIYGQAFYTTAASTISARLRTLGENRNKAQEAMDRNPGRMGSPTYALHRTAVQRYDAVVGQIQGAPPPPPPPRPRPTTASGDGGQKDKDKQKQGQGGTGQGNEEDQGGEGRQGNQQPVASSLATLIKQAAIAQALATGRGVFLKVQNASGSIFVRRNLWTFFGIGSYQVSAAAVVSYSVIDGSSDRALAAGTIYKVIPYTSVRKISDVDE